MRPIAPRTGAPEVTVAEDQPEYMPITVALYNYEDGSRGILSRWQPSTEERLAISSGEDIFVQQLSFDTPMAPLVVRCGPGNFQVSEGSLGMAKPQPEDPSEALQRRFSEMCDNLQRVVQDYKLGGLGRPLDEIVVNAIASLTKQLEDRTEQLTRSQAESLERFGQTLALRLRAEGVEQESDELIVSAIMETYQACELAEFGHPNAGDWSVDLDKIIKKYTAPKADL